jgi:hypothetical protein
MARIHLRLKLKGRRFGRLKVVKYAGTSKGYTFWLCKCDCGKSKVVVGKGLKFGDTNSCGCLVAELARKRCGKLASRYLHGMGNTRTHSSWMNMLTRCRNPNTPKWEHYGGRGITVCDRWQDKKKGFLNFLRDMNERPEGKTLDRIDVNGNYEPSNCRWATPTEQNANRRCSVLESEDFKDPYEEIY